MTALTHHLTARIRDARARAHERREHDRAMADPRIRAEHYAGRARDVAAGGRDCHLCL